MELLRQRTRIILLSMALVGLFGLLAWRLVELQVVRHEEFLGKADRSHALRILLKAHRGEIRDVRGEVLARSLPARTVCADPSVLGTNYPTMARLLAPLLGTNETYLLSALQPRLRTDDLGRLILDRRGRPITNQYVRLRRKVPEEQWRLIERTLATETFGLPTNRIRDIRQLRRSISPDREEDEIRVYPNRGLAASVLGFTDVDGHGLEGLEAFLDEQLKGVDGYIDTERSVLGSELRRFREIEMPPEHGRHVVLTLDTGLQLILEEELQTVVTKFQAEGGCAVAVQPRTGRVLGMASWPGFDPNDPPLRSPDPLWRRNWAVSHTFEPGSTFKLVAATAVMNEGLADLHDVFDCGERGRWQQQFGRELVRLTDVHVIKERYAPLERVIAESSNIGTFQLALRLGRERYSDYVFRFGFGQKTGVRLPLEERGLLRPPPRWSMTDFSRVAMGYTVSVTPLQLAMAMSALANDGRLLRPQIIDRVEAADGTVLAQPGTEMVREVCRPAVAAKVRQALREVVEDGTGTLVKMERYTVAGKTGTSKIAPYREEKYNSSFVGFFPTEAPELCVVVVLKDPNPRIGYYGGRVAGPAFKNIAQRAAEYLGIPPDVARSTEETSAERPADRNRTLIAVAHRP